LTERANENGGRGAPVIPKTVIPVYTERVRGFRVRVRVRVRLRLGVRFRVRG